MSFLLEICCCCIVENETNITNTLTSMNNAVPVGILPSDNNVEIINNNPINSPVQVNSVREINDAVQHVSFVSMLTS